MANLKEAFEYASKNPTSDFANNLKSLAGSGSLDQEAKKYGIDLTPFKTKPVEAEKPSQMSRLGTDLMGRVENVKNQIRQVKDSETVAGTVGQAAQTNLRVMGQAAGAVGDVIGAGVNAATGGGLDKLGEYIASTETGQKLGSMLQQFQQDNPETAEVLGDVFNIASLVPVGAAAKPVASGVAKGIQGVGKVAKETTEALAEGATQVAQGIKPLTEGITAIPRRVAANVAEKQATEKVIQSLPSKVAQVAARDGVDIADINIVSKLPKQGVKQYDDLLNSAKKFAAGESQIDPIEQVGKPLVAQLKKADAERKIIGKQLGEVADNLGMVTKPELETSVFANLKGTKGLEGLKVKNGKLDFSETVIANTPADQKAVQQAFTNATKWGNGKKAHLYRQELFETLGGKKRSLEMMTDTQEKALEAVRKGLSDVLETKNPQYKTLSNQYRSLIQPLQEMRKLSKTLDPNATDDVLDLSAGLLARRLTSNAASNPRIREALRMLDSATTAKGTAKLSTENLMDLYNVLGKYYDIAAKTGFKGQIESVAGPLETAMSAIKGVAGSTPAVRQKALENLLKELSNAK
jgi:hypothetical protein